MRQVNAIHAIDKELTAANKMFGPFASLHEGYAVLLEEVDELWDEIKKKNPDPVKVHKEAKQVGAMAAKFLMAFGQEEFS